MCPWRDAQEDDGLVPLGRVVVRQGRGVGLDPPAPALLQYIHDAEFLHPPFSQFGGNNRPVKLKEILRSSDKKKKKSNGSNSPRSAVEDRFRLVTKSFLLPFFSSQNKTKKQLRPL